MNSEMAAAAVIGTLIGLVVYLVVLVMSRKPQSTTSSVRNR